MKYYAQIDGDRRCIAVITGDDILIDPDYIEIPSLDVSLLRQQHDAGTDTWSPGPPVYRTLLTFEEWADSLGDDIYDEIIESAYTKGHRPDAIRKRLRRLVDAIRMTNSFDVASSKADQLYQRLETAGVITPAERADLQRGVPE